MFHWLLKRCCLLSLCGVLTSAATAGDYAIVVSKKTARDAAWAKVVGTLKSQHAGTVIEYDQDVSNALVPLKQQFPKYACFVATSEEASREYVAQVHRLTRQLDDDPYTDVLWGILTGYDAENALKIASEKQPLVIGKVAAGTDIALDCCREGVWFSEGKAGLRMRKSADQSPKKESGPADSTRAIADSLTRDQAQLFVTSGHATERDWQIGYSYKNGKFVSKKGELFGVDLKGEKFALHSDEPRVYLAVGNCLMGHIDGQDAMALAFMNSLGTRQMVGYTVLTWYGYAGWGCLDYFVEQPGRFTLAEAFFANQQALIHRLEKYAPDLLKENPTPGQTVRNVKLSSAAKQAGVSAQDLAGLLHDRDVLALYGDPGWSAKMAEGKRAWEQTLTEKEGVYTFEVKRAMGEKSFATLNGNGSQRGGRPIIQFLPKQLKNVKVLSGDELKPVITDTFLLLPLPDGKDTNKSFKITFEGDLAR